MKGFAKRILKKIGILYLVQYSGVWRRFKNPGYRKNFSSNITFINDLFGTYKPVLIFDIGAHVGDCTDFYRKLAQRVVAVEPDLKNFGILKSRFGRDASVKIVNAAVSNFQGKMNFFIENEGSAKNTLSQKWVDTLENADATRFKTAFYFSRQILVESVTLHTLIAEYGKPDYIKIDVEGFEWEVIQGLQHENIRCISFESNLPEFESETISIIKRLMSLNPKYVFNFVQNGRFYFSGNLSGDEMILWVSSRKFRFLEIYSILHDTY